MSITKVSLGTQEEKALKACTDRSQFQSEGRQTTVVTPHHDLQAVRGCGSPPKKETAVVRKRGALSTHVWVLP